MHFKCHYSLLLRNIAFDKCAHNPAVRQHEQKIDSMGTSSGSRGATAAHRCRSTFLNHAALHADCCCGDCFLEHRDAGSEAFRVVVLNQRLFVIVFFQVLHKVHQKGILRRKPWRGRL